MAESDAGSDDAPHIGAVLFTGYLKVTDADRFRTALEHGIGSGKAFGFGLLSIAAQ
jgi:CRISPR-associated protein, Cse3 family